MSHTPEQQSRDELRSQLQAARRQLSSDRVTAHSKAISSHLKPFVEPSMNVAGYLALGNEVQIEEVLLNARQMGCKIYVPIVQPENQMVFAPLNDNTAMTKNQFGIKEPVWKLEECIPATELDLVLVPLVGFDAQCQRMGMGGGYYDRAFRANREANTSKAIGKSLPKLVGVAYDIQEADSVLPDWWDVPLDFIVTESRILQKPTTLG